MKETIYDLLNSLSVNRKYKGYLITALCCELLLENEMLLFSASRELYPQVADKYGCYISCIERNIRTVVYRAWDCGRERLIEIAGYNMKCPPTVIEFLGILMNYLQRQKDPVCK